MVDARVLVDPDDPIGWGSGSGRRLAGPRAGTGLGAPGALAGGGVPRLVPGQSKPATCRRKPKAPEGFQSKYGAGRDSVSALRRLRAGCFTTCRSDPDLIPRESGGAGCHARRGGFVMQLPGTPVRAVLGYALAQSLIAKFHLARCFAGKREQLTSVRIQAASAKKAPSVTVDLASTNIHGLPCIRETNCSACSLRLPSDQKESG